jgi:hypothetical protein
VRGEGTGTWPDYFVNDKKMEGKNLHRNREIVVKLTVGVWDHTDS